MELLDDATERCWDEFWAPIVMKNGVLDLSQIKKELYDFHVVMENVSEVYMHVTGGRISKVNTLAESVIAESESREQEDYERAVVYNGLIDPCDGNHGGKPCRDAECWQDHHEFCERNGERWHRQRRDTTESYCKCGKPAPQGIVYCPECQP